MQTHTFIAESANEAVERIRAELGPSAVVLSVRKLPRTGLARLAGKEKIEVTASVEKRAARAADDSWPDLRQEVRALQQQFAALRLAQSAAAEPASSAAARLLTESGLLPQFASQMVQQIPPGQAAGDLVPALRKILKARWRGEPVRSEAAVHLFVGVPGSGKSTVLCKMLAQASLIERQPATVFQLDTHIANASAAPSIFAEIVGAPFERTLPEAFERREESVFVDVPGVPQGDERGLRALRPVIEAFGVPEVHLVLNAAYEAPLLLEQARFFAGAGVTDLILTHLDEEARWGKVWNLVLGTNFSVRFLSSGQNVPGELAAADADAVLDRQFREK